MRTAPANESCGFSSINTVHFHFDNRWIYYFNFLCSSEVFLRTFEEFDVITYMVL